MINVLIVDDNNDRSFSIKDSLVSKIGHAYCSVTIANTINRAKKLLLQSKYDLLILDVVLPKRDGDTASSRNGLLFLDDIFSRKSRYKKPNDIIGITSFTGELDDFQKAFEEKWFKVFPAPFNSNQWIEKLVSHVQYIFDQRISIDQHSEDHVVITVHGIRTYGGWQKRFEEILKQFSPQSKCIPFRYGYFSLFSFFIPFLRSIEVNHFAEGFKAQLSEIKDKKVSIIAHSFGTYIVAKALNKIDLSGIKIHKIIFAASVLKSRFNFSNALQSNVETIVFDCSLSDFVLILCNIFVPGCGMAGRVGYYGFNSKIVSRFFSGGHSLYFNFDSINDISFMEKHWIPLIVSDEFPAKYEPPAVVNPLCGFIETIIDYSGKIKLGLLILMFLIVYYLVLYLN